MEGLVVGDVVQLNSGGVKMTVSEIRETATGVEILCTWFQAHGVGHRLVKKAFDARVLCKVEQTEPY